MLQYRFGQVIFNTLKSKPLNSQQLRFLNIHEYQGKQLMDKYGVNTQRWKLAESPQQAKQAALDLNCSEFVVKSQIHAGGRGKGTFDNGFKGGVHITTDPEEVKTLAEKMLGARLRTKQTSAEGVVVRKLMIVESIDFTKEYYFAIVMDRTYNGPVLVASPQGGMDIEQVAEDTPHLIFKRKIDYLSGIQKDDSKWIAEKLGFSSSDIPKVQEQVENLYKLFVATDATQVEINPLVQTKAGKVYCVDAKINFDDNAEFRQKEIYEGYRDTTEEDPREVDASKYGLNYIGMDGNIGCMVNGAGLAMATMDIIKQNNGDPANFLDVGGGATTKQVTEAFKILTADPKVKAILVNIFGGIMKCDIIAEGIVTAAREVGLKIPLVVRLEGTNVDVGLKILKESGLPIITAKNLDDAAQKAVATIH